jgi:phage gp16-like protein
MATRGAIGPDSAEQRRRRAELAAIHCAKKQLHLDDEVYRAVVERVTGHRSAAELNGEERRKLLDEFRRLGFQQTPEHAPARENVITAQGRLIWVLWRELEKMGAITLDNSDRCATYRALGAFIKRVAKVDSVRWLSPEAANKVIEGLKSWLAREKVAREKRA